MRLMEYLRSNAPYLATGALLTFLSSFGQTFFISLFAGELRIRFDLGHGAWGGIYMLGTLGSALVMVWAGALTDRLRVRVLAPYVLLGLACSCIAMALNPWVWALPFVIFLLRFFGQGMSIHIAVVAITRWFDATRGRALSIATLGVLSGEALLPLVVVAAFVVLPWQAIWWIAAALCILSLPILSRLLRQERTPAALSEAIEATGMHARHWTRNDALRHPLFWVMLPVILGPSAFNTALFFHQVHFADVKNVTHLNFVALFPLYTAVGIAAMIVSGWALDKYGTARLIPYYQLPMAVAFLVFAVAAGPWAIALAFVFLGLTSGANATLPNAFWAEFYGTAHIGSVKALATAIMVLGSAIGPGLTGALIDLGVGLEAQFVGVAVYFVATAGLMLWGVSKAATSLNPAVA